MIKAVLFDLDGTLVNTLEDLADSINFALGKYGFPTHETEKFKYFVGDGMQSLVRKALPEDARGEENEKKIFEAFYAYYKVHFIDKSHAYDGIKEVLAELKDKGYKIAVVSNKAQEMTDEVTLKIFGDIFDIICGKREGYAPKPDPTLTLEIISELGVKPEECVFIGDSGSDAVTAINTGTTGIGALWGFRTEEELRNGGDRYIVSHPSYIPQIIKEVENGI